MGRAPDESLRARSLNGVIRGSVLRAGWSVADQALSSASNLGLSVVAARELGPAGFGAFTIAFTSYLVAMNASRAIATEPLVVRFSHSSTPAWRRAASAAAGTALCVGLLVGAVFFVLGLLLKGIIGQAFVGLGLVLPGLLLQDAWRFAFFASGTPRRAFSNDACWVLVLLPVGLMLLLGEATVLRAILGWGGAATCAAVYGAWQARMLPNLRRVRSWLREHRDLAPRYLGEFLAISGTLQAVVVGVGVIAGLAATGALRAGEVLLGPARVLFQGMQLSAVPEGVRLLRTSPAALRQGCMWLAVFMASTTTLIGTLLLLLPNAVGEALLSETWTPARPVVLPLTVSMAAAGILSAALVGLRATGDARRSLRSRLWVAAVLLPVALAGAVLNGAVGAAWGYAVAQSIGAVLWWHALLRSLRDHQVIRVA